MKRTSDKQKLRVFPTNRPPLKKLLNSIANFFHIVSDVGNIFMEHRGEWKRLVL